jgi:hypothetical protein
MRMRIMRQIHHPQHLVLVVPGFLLVLLLLLFLLVLLLLLLQLQLLLLSLLLLGVMSFAVRGVLYLLLLPQAVLLLKNEM